ncbi:DUF2497 domain-containing protein [Nitratireductor mangrovi]|uniref:DUF2497 domain-containing protein n=1 Tax=Nitratireductor mangrovi TaxID=2599600 RepID=A0A5B8L5F6_9HYPH|nr:DUF2497 domain-containing protein [Nitratireductor mangrovi]
MPQSTSLQKEPSMEEILASIRRIIEDSDQGRPATDETEVDEVAAGTTDDDTSPEMRSFSEELGKGEEPQPDEHVDLEVPQAAVPEWTEPEHATEAGQEDERDAFTELSSAMEAEIESAPVTEPAAYPTASDEDRGGTEAVRAGIISERTGRQVAAAFDELSDAFAENRRKRFDEMAEEMIRPMLQDWLDNNLPTLVEKLVREEIERIARGDR